MPLLHITIEILECYLGLFNAPDKNEECFEICKEKCTKNKTFNVPFLGDTNLMRQLELRLNLYNVWRNSMQDTINKLKQHKEGEDINVKTTVIFGLINHIDPWADSELKKLHELGLYKIFEIDCKPIYRENVMVSYILAQIRGMMSQTTSW